MLRGVLLRLGDRGHAVIFKREDGFVFRAMVVIDAFDVLEEREPPYEEQENSYADGAFDQINSDVAMQRGPTPRQPARGAGGNKLVHENEKRDGKYHTGNDGPSTDLRLFSAVLPGR